MQQLELTDECGEANTISGHVALMVPFYYFPLALALMMFIVKLVSSIKKFYGRKSVGYRYACVYMCAHTLAMIC